MTPALFDDDYDPNAPAECDGWIPVERWIANESVRVGTELLTGLEAAGLRFDEARRIELATHVAHGCARYLCERIEAMLATKH